MLLTFYHTIMHIKHKKIQFTNESGYIFLTKNNTRRQNKIKTITNGIRKIQYNNAILIYQLRCTRTQGLNTEDDNTLKIITDLNLNMVYFNLYYANYLGLSGLQIYV